MPELLLVHVLDALQHLEEDLLHLERRQVARARVEEPLQVLLAELEDHHDLHVVDDHVPQAHDVDVVQFAEDPDFADRRGREALVRVFDFDLVSLPF